MDEPYEYERLHHVGRVVRVHTVGVRLPNGKVMDRDLLRFNPAVVVLAVRDDGEIVMIRNERYAVGEVLLELPAGMVDDGEEPKAAAARELREETGYTARTFVPLASFYTGPGAMDERMHAYLATGLSKGPQALEEYERIEVVEYPAEDVERMVLSGEICDAKTLAALGVYWLRRRTRQGPTGPRERRWD